MKAIITRDRIDVSEIIKDVESTNAGGIVVFIGTVRDHSDKLTDIEKLEMEAYEEMAQKELEKIVSEAEDKFGTRVSAAHRIGMMNLNDVIVCIASSGSHRDEAFSSTRYVIDEIKKRLPLWKKEISRHGINWVNHP